MNLSSPIRSALLKQFAVFFFSLLNIKEEVEEEKNLNLHNTDKITDLVFQRYALKACKNGKIRCIMHQTKDYLRLECGEVLSFGLLIFFLALKICVIL